MAENDLTELGDILKDRIAALKSDRDRARESLTRITLRPKLNAFSADAIERFGQIMRQNITTGPIPFRKAYIKSVVDRIEVDDHAIRIIGDQATLEQVVAGGDQSAGPNVRSSTEVARPNRIEPGPIGRSSEKPPSSEAITVLLITTALGAAIVDRCSL